MSGDRDDVGREGSAKGGLMERLRQLGSQALTLAVVLLVTFAARSALADHYHVPSESMEWTLHAGDRVIVNKMAYGLRVPFTDVEIWDRAEPQRGDVVVFDSPTSGVRLIKRIVAVGGDHVSVRGGRLIINGRPLAAADDPQVEVFGENRARLNLDDGGGPDVELDIPPGHVLVMGDHRGNSIDGRFFGTIPEDAIYGRAFRIYFRRGEGLVWRPL